MTASEWVLLGVLVFVIVFELVAAIGKRYYTISQSVWRLRRALPWTRIVGTVVSMILVLHFWWGLWD